MTAGTGYERDGARIYRESFAIIRAEADLSAVPPDLEPVAVRMIHACGLTDLPAHLAWSPGAGAAARRALAGGAAVLCDSNMVAAGITRSRLPAANQAALTGRTFFPGLLQGPFHSGLIIVFGVSAALSVLAGLASLLRGKRQAPQPPAAVTRVASGAAPRR